MSYEAWTAKAVEHRVVEAAETLMLTPNVGGGSSAWPQFIRSAEESYGYGSSWYKRRPEPGALDRMMATWGWINALPAEHDRKLLYAWAWTKARRGKFLNNFAAREGVNSKTLRRMITRICQRIADALNKDRITLHGKPVDEVSEIAPEIAPQTVSSESRATHYLAPDGKPEHLPESPEHLDTIRRIERLNRRRARASRPRG